MKNLLVNLIFSMLYIATGLVWYFGLIQTHFFAFFIFVILAVNLFYSTRLSGKTEGASKEFLEREKYKEEKSRRNIIIDRAAVVTDSMTARIYKLRLEIRNIFYSLE